MKKILMISLAMLLVGSLAFGHQLMSDPAGNMTSQFPAVYVNVHNDVANADDIAAGNVVVLDIDASTGDNDFYVARTSTADTGIVVGVVWPNAIASGSSGSMVIYGMAECDADAGGVAEQGLICASGTAGGGGDCAASDGSGSYATATAAIGASAQGKCFVDIK